MDHEREAHDGQGGADGRHDGLGGGEEKGGEDEQGGCADAVEDAHVRARGRQLPSHVPCGFRPPHL